MSSNCVKIAISVVICILFNLAFCGVSAYAAQHPGEMTDWLEDGGAYISRVEVLDITDGTAIWDSNDEPGNDSGPSNKVVRTFDSIKYDLEYVVTPYDDSQYDYYKWARIGMRVVIPYTSDQVSFDMDSMGWLDTEDGYQAKVTTEEIDGKQCQVLTAYRQIIGTSSIPTVVPGTGTLSLFLDVRGCANGDIIDPDVKIWVAGGEDKNQSTYGNPIGKNLDVDAVRVSAYPNYNVQLKIDNSSNGSGNFDFNSGSDTAPNKGLGLVNGKYYNFGVALGLWNANEPKKLKGVELPDGSDITFDVKITSTLKTGGGGGNTPHDVTSTYTPLVYVGEGNNTASTKQGSQRNVVINGNPYAYIHNTPYNRWAEQGVGNHYRTTYEGGKWSVEQDGNILHITVSDYKIDPYSFPYANGGQTDETYAYYNPDTGISNKGLFSSGGFWMVQPYNNLETGQSVFDEFGATDAATFEVVYEDYNLKARSISGRELPSVNDTSNQVITNDDRASASKALIPPGSFNDFCLYTYKDNTNARESGTDALNYWDNAQNGTDAAQLGEELRIFWGPRQSPSDIVNFQIAANCFLKFDDKRISYDPTRATGCNGAERLAHTKFFYVAKTSKGGWADDDEMKAASMYDDNLVFFEDYQQLLDEGYTCVGLLMECRHSEGDTPFTNSYYLYTTPIIVTDDPEYIGDVAMITSEWKVWTRKTARADAAEKLGKDMYSLDKADFQTYVDQYFPSLGKGEGEPTEYDGTWYVNRGPDYDKAIYGPNGYAGGHTGTNNIGDSLYIVGEFAKISKKVAQTQNNKPKRVFDMDYQQRAVDYELSATVLDSIGDVSTRRTTLTIEDVLPKGLTYIPGSAMYGGTYSEHTPDPGVIEGGTALDPDVASNDDGSTTLTFTLPNIEPQQLKPIYYSASIGNPGNPDEDVINNQQLTNQVTIASTLDKRAGNAESGNLATSTISISKLRQQSLSIYAEPLYNEQNSTLTFHSTIGNYGNSNLVNALGVNIMPYNGDAASTSYHGSYSVESMKVDLSRVSDVSDVTIWFTSDPAWKNKPLSSYSLDAIRSSWTSATVNPTTGQIAIPTGMSKPTAWAVHDASLPSNESVRVTMNIIPDGNYAGDIYGMLLTDTDNSVKSAVYVVSREVSGVAWKDVDWDDTRTEVDQLLFGVKVRLIDSSGRTVNNFDNNPCEMITGNDGAYHFEKVPSGNFTIEFSPTNGNWSKYGIVEKDYPKAGDSADSDADAVMENGVLKAMKITPVNMPEINKMATNKHLVRYMDAGLKELGGELSLYKMDSEGDHSTPVSGATFKIEGTTAAGDAFINEEVTSLGDGELELGYVPYGSYTITETSVKTGYIKPAHAWSMTVDATGVHITSADGLVDGMKLLNIKGDAKLAVEKSVDKSNAVIGDKLTYTIKVTNTGNCTLAPVTITDGKLGITNEKIADSLAAGASKTVTKTYNAVTEADAKTGKVVNTVSAHGTPPAGVPQPEDPTDDVSTVITMNPKITIEKSAAPTVITNGKVGDNVTWSFKISNTGNVRITNLTIEDAYLSSRNVTVTPEKTELAVGESTTATARSTLTQSEIDAGKVTNTATVKAKNPVDNANVSSDPSTADVVITRVPNLTIDKIVDKSVADIGDSLVYTITVKNTGNVTLAPVTISDPLLDVIGRKIADSLAPNEEATTTLTYSKVTENDAIARKVENVASAHGTPPVGVDPPTDPKDEASTVVRSHPSISIEKSVDPTKIDPAKAGDNVTWNFIVTNTGDITLSDISIADDYLARLGKEITLSATKLSPGAKATAQVTTSASQVEVDAGKIDNVASAQGTEPVDKKPVISSPDDASVELVRHARLAIEKNVDKSQANIGDTLNYTIKITNTGNVTLSPVILDDPLVGKNNVVAAQSLAPGKSVEIQASYTPVTETDAVASAVVNTASASGTPPSGVQPPQKVFDSARTSVISHPSIKLHKTANPTSIENAKAEDKITWNFEVTNIGDITLDAIAISDTYLLDSVGMVTLDRTKLAPGEKAYATVTSTISQAEINTGYINNEASVRGSSGDGKEVTDDDDAQVVLGRAAALSLEKDVDKSVADIGDVLNYTIKITNTGNVTLAPVVLDDPLLDISSSKASDSLEPGKSVTVTGTHNVVEADAIAKEVVNVATATGTPPSGVAAPKEVKDDAKTSIRSHPLIKISKNVTPQRVDNAALGNEVTWDFEVENAGDVTLNDVHIADEMLKSRNMTVTIDKTKLAPGEKSHGSVKMPLTQEDIDAGRITNIATAIGKEPVDGSDVNSVPDDAIVDIVRLAKLSIEKDVDTETAHIGDTLNYTIKITNTGNVTLSPVTLNDELLGIYGEVLAEKLIPGEQVVKNGEYKVTEEDAIAGSVVNIAQADGTPPSGVEKPGPVEDEAKTLVETTPSISLLKTANRTSIDPVDVGDEITWSFEITNTGDITLEKISIVDPMLNESRVAIENLPNKLVPGEKANVSAVYHVTQSDIDAGFVLNTATVKATSVAGKEIESNESKANVELRQHPDLVINKSVDISDVPVAVAGQTRLTYMIEIANIGNVTLTDLNVIDDLHGLDNFSVDWTEKGEGVIAPGAKVIAHASYVVSQADINRGSVKNTAWAIGKSRMGDIESNHSEVITTLGKDDTADMITSTSDESGAPLLLAVIIFAGIALAVNMRRKI